MILCLGPTPCFQRTMTFDNLSLDAVNRTSRVHEFASGKSTNVARVLHSLGEEVMAITFIGGMRGRAFRDDLEASGIAHDLIEVAPQTRMAITVVDRAAGTATELLEESHELGESDYEAMLGTLSKHLPKARMLVISGTLTPHAPADFYARCVKLAEPKVPVIVDAVGPPLLETLSHKPSVVKPNRSEVGRTLGMDVTTDRALVAGMRELVARGARWVVVTNGRKEVVITNGDSFWQIATPSVRVISAIGSGDAFAAGLAAALRGGQELPQAALLAAACGAANAMTAHAGHVHPAEVSAVLAQLRIEERSLPETK